MTTFTVATNEYRSGNSERTEYHAFVAWDRLAETCGQSLSKGQLVDVEQTVGLVREDGADSEC